MGEDGQLAIASNPAIILNHFDVGDFHKKRKYEEEEEEEFGHPIRKSKFQVRSHECGFECQIHAEESEREANKEPSFPLDRTGSVEDSNSFMGIYADTTLSMDAESADQTFMEPYKPYSAEATSSSGNSFNSVNDRRTLYSLESRRDNDKTCRKSKESVPTTLEDGTRYKLKSMQDPLSGFEMNYEAYADFVCSEYAIDKDQISDFPTEELLYSNDVEPNMLLLSSGGWNSMQEAQGDNRKPTIDQEFEQYFSSLML